MRSGMQAPRRWLPLSDCLSCLLLLYIWFSCLSPAFSLRTELVTSIPCSGTDSVLKASPTHTSLQRRDLDLQSSKTPLQVSWHSSWKSTDKVWTASEPDPVHIPSPGTAETPFIACSLAQSLLAHTALLLFCGLGATGNSFISIWQVCSQTLLDSWPGFLPGSSREPEVCFCS